MISLRRFTLLVLWLVATVCPLQGFAPTTSLNWMTQQAVLLPDVSQNRILSTTASEPRSVVHMAGISPPEPSQHHPTAAVIISAIALALAIATFRPPPTEEGYLMHIPPMESSTNIISKLEVQPLPGVGFGGIGIGPGFAPLPFGGFGMGFKIENRPSEEQTIEAQKHKLEAIKAYEQRLQAEIKSMEKDQEQKTTN